MASETSKGNILERILHDQNAEPENLPLSLLEAITDNFSEDHKIGQGGFAHVYKGSLQNGTMPTVAVKKIIREHVVNDAIFKQELDSLMKAKHKNIVRFLGYCSNTEKKIVKHNGKNIMVQMEQKLFCFEFMPKGNLDQHITGPNDGLEWKTRYQILKGICEGLHHLHMNYIIHLDLKPANILLNDNMEPKICDFGLSRLLDKDQTRIYTSTSNITGSLGYIAPERFKNPKELSFESDIYSLGIIIWEILTGRKGYTAIDTVLKSWQAGGDTQLKQVKVCTYIGQQCIDSNPMMRPSTQRILGLLQETERFSSFMVTHEKTIERHLPDTTQRLEEKETNMKFEKPQTSLHEQRQDVTPISLSPQELEVEEQSQKSLNKKIQDVTPISLSPQELEVEEKSQKSLNGKIQGNQDQLIKCVSQYLGFSSGKPIAACLIYRCLLHWRSFEVERTGIFERIIQTIGSAIESQDNNDKLAYWFSNSSTLLLLLERTLKITRADGLTPRRSSAASFGRVFSGMRASPQSAGRAFLGSRLIGGLGDLRQVKAKAKSPALLFKQQLTDFLEKMYRMIRDNFKKEISPLLVLCIQAPGTSRASLIKGSRSQANALPQQTLIAHWQSIVKILTNYLNVLKANYVHSFLISKMFTQIFSFINVHLFNSLLLQRECCSFSNGEYMKVGLAELEQWCIYATEEYAGSSWEELKHIRQAVGFLVNHQKPKKTLKEITNDLCPVLSIQQLYRISTMYWNDIVSSDVNSSVRVMMTEDFNDAVRNSLLLGDDYSIPFSVDDISKSMAEVKVADVVMPRLILESSGFAFLHKRSPQRCPSQTDNLI